MLLVSPQDNIKNVFSVSGDNFKITTVKLQSKSFSIQILCLI